MENDLSSSCTELPKSPEALREEEIKEREAIMRLYRSGEIEKLIPVDKLSQFRQWNCSDGY